MASATLPDLAFLTQSFKGAGIAGNVEVNVLGHLEAMTMSLNFRNFTEDAAKLFEPRRHNISLYVAQQQEDTVNNTLSVQDVKHTFGLVPKTLKGGSLEPAAPSNPSGEYAVRYWKTVVDGKVVLEIDPYNYICTVNSVDYLEPVRKALGK